MNHLISRQPYIFGLLFLLACTAQGQGLQVRFGVRSVFAPRGPQPDFNGQSPGTLLPQVQVRPSLGYEIGLAKTLRVDGLEIQPGVTVSLSRIKYNLFWTSADGAAYATQAVTNQTTTAEFILPFRKQLIANRYAFSVLLGPFVQVRNSHYTETSQGTPNTIYQDYQRERYGIEKKYRTGYGVAAGGAVAVGRFDVRLLGAFGKTALFASDWQRYKSCTVSLTTGYTIGGKRQKAYFHQ